MTRGEERVVPRVTAANRWLLLLILALACLAAPSAAGGTSITINPVVQGTMGSNGWYVSNVNVSWYFNPPPDSVSGCFVGTITDEGHTHIVCTATWNGVASLTYTLDIYIDKTPPAVHAVPSRKPNANGWYNKRVSFSFAGTDATSGVASCSSTSYSGPDNGNASVKGTCTDKAGNVGNGAYAFSYDATPPSVGPLIAKPGNRSVLLEWTDSADTRISQLTRTGANGAGKVVYRGRDKAFRDKGLRVGAKYHYTVTAFDEAANRAVNTVAITATGRLLNPVPGQRVTSPPHLAWLPAKGAGYYNVQLIRGKQILSTWPARTSLKLRRSWIFHGHRYRLRPGVYRWYVWPGFGKRKQAHYGPLLGSNSFVYAP
jgi:hypothetical protein